MDDDEYWFEPIGGVGSLHDLQSDNDPRNPKLAGFRSVSYAASVAMRRPETKRRPIGFHVPRPKAR